MLRQPYGLLATTILEFFSKLLVDLANRVQKLNLQTRVRFASLLAAALRFTEISSGLARGSAATD
ncbi:MAG: hypothetical protein U0236_15815 [Nitrospira sp.]